MMLNVLILMMMVHVCFVRYDAPHGRNLMVLLLLLLLHSIDVVHDHLFGAVWEVLLVHGLLRRMASLLQVDAFGIVSGAGRGRLAGVDAWLLLVGSSDSLGLGRLMLGLADAAAGEVRLARCLPLGAALGDRDRWLGRRSCQFRF